MKTSKIYSILLAAGSLSLFGSSMVSCDDYLTVLPTDQITEEAYWTDATDVENVRAAAYKQMLSCTSRILIWGELRSDNLTLNEMSDNSINHLQQAILQPTESMFDWSPFYTGINYCNLILEKGEEMTKPGEEVDPSFRESDWRPIKAEMLSLRALYYFYLVRAYRNVPYVTTPVRTDAEAMNSKLRATHGIVILTNLINQLEEAKDYAAENFGSDSDNKSRFTKRGVRALLADIYLWRGAMLKNLEAKGDTAVVLPGTTDTLTTASANLLSTESFKGAIENCNWILDDYKQKYDEELLKNPNNTNVKDEDEYPYPYMLEIMGNNGSTSSKSNVYDFVYSSIWGNKASSESILELWYDGVDNINTTYNTYVSEHTSSAILGAKKMIGNSALIDKGNPTTGTNKGFGHTDFRMVGTYYMTPTSTTYPIQKNIIKYYTVENAENVTEMKTIIVSSSSYRLNSSNDANWPVYRLSDVMLMKAEAIARVNASNKAATEDDGIDGVNEGFKLTNQLFRRYNPGLQKTGTSGATKVSDRLKPDYAYASPAKTAGDLLKLVYHERQREFIAEGKRWFDVVRQAEASNDFEDLFTYIDLASSVKNRLRKIDAMYNPIYSEELKVNGNLKQNPVWDRYSK